MAAVAADPEIASAFRESSSPSSKLQIVGQRKLLRSWSSLRMCCAALGGRCISLRAGLACWGIGTGWVDLRVGAGEGGGGSVRRRRRRCRSCCGFRARSLRRPRRWWRSGWCPDFGPRCPWHACCGRIGWARCVIGGCGPGFILVNSALDRSFSF